MSLKADFILLTPAAIVFYLIWTGGAGFATAFLWACGVYAFMLLIYVIAFASWIPRTGGYSGCGDDEGGSSFGDIDTEGGGLTYDLVYYEEVISNKD